MPKRRRLILAAVLLALLQGREAAGQKAPAPETLSYGTDAAQALDIYAPKSAGLHPFVMYIHGGGWWNGDKRYLATEDVAYFLKRDVAVVSINYRNITEAQRARIWPPIVASLSDACAALDYLAEHAAELRLDTSRYALYGGSAGAFNALWLGLQGIGKAPDRKVSCNLTLPPPAALGGENAITSLDPVQMQAWVGPDIASGGQAFGLPERDFQSFVARRDALLPWIKELSPSYLLSRNSPPIFLYYAYPLDDPDHSADHAIHSPHFGLGLAELAVPSGASVRFVEAGAADRKRKTQLLDFLWERLSAPKP